MTNPAREALTRAVNRAIEEGAPVYVNKADPTLLTTMPTLGLTDSGAEIKMRRTLPNRSGNLAAEIVLCHLPWNTVTPFVTWQANTDSQYGGTYWGHYFKADEADEAVTDFMKRGR
jgi:hypothetical protein